MTQHSTADTHPERTVRAAGEPALHHVGIVAADLAKAMGELAVAFGYAWLPVVTMTMPVLDGDREDHVTVSYAMSANGTPRMELVQAVPGTLWAPDTAGPHHVALWADDLTTDSGRLVALGHPRELSRRGADGRPEAFAYHRLAPLCLHVELLDGGLRPGAEAVGW